jgi:hypothetical protein
MGIHGSQTGAWAPPLITSRKAYGWRRAAVCVDQRTGWAGRPAETRPLITSYRCTWLINGTGFARRRRRHPVNHTAARTWLINGTNVERWCSRRPLIAAAHVADPVWQQSAESISEVRRCPQHRTRPLITAVDHSRVE